MLRNSELFHTAVNKFPGDTHPLGDGGYPLLRCASVKTTADLPDLLIVALSTPYLTVFGVHLMLMKLPYTVPGTLYAMLLPVKDFYSFNFKFRAIT